MKPMSLLLSCLLPLTTHAQTPSYPVETFPTPGGHEVAITLIKHGSLAITFEGKTIQVDPVGGYGKPTDYAQFPINSSLVSLLNTATI